MKIHLRDERGEIVHTIPEPINLCTELVYADGSPTTYMPLSLLKIKINELTALSSSFN